MLACCSDIDIRTDGIVLWLLNIRLNDMLMMMKMMEVDRWIMCWCL